MQLPPALLNSLEQVESFDKAAFEKVHLSGEQVTSIRINPFKPVDQFLHPGITMSKIPWTGYGYYLDQRPSFTFDPFFHAGAYYVQEASSMFLEQALKQSVDLTKSLKVLDLCAAPGGKSTHLQSLISPDSLLVSNEVIRSRANVLKENMIKWGAGNVVVTNNDPKDLSRLENFFDVIVIDAPCSGSGLFRRDPEAISEWSENNVHLCSQRQQRIIADSWPSLKKDGILIYSTCSYSKEEDEDIMDWLMKEFSIKNCPLAVDPSWGIEPVESSGGAMGYRCWPDKVKGEGFFLACFQKKEGQDDGSVRIKNKPEPATQKEIALIEKWVKKDDQVFIKHENTVYAWPSSRLQDWSFLLGRLRVIYSGVLVAELMRDKLIPDHALAMSLIRSDSITRTELNPEQAIQYLQRKELKLETKNKGWQLVSYRHHPLGWINALPGRINNYYPKEMRILKDI